MSELLRRLVEAEKYRLESEPEGISDLVYYANLRDFINYAARGCGAETCVSVTDLVYCSNKYHFKQKYPEILLKDNLYAAWAGYGRLIHGGLQQILVEHGFKVEYEVNKLIDMKDEMDLIVGLTGRIDALGVWKDKLTVVEIKSSRSDNDLPKEHHILQLRIYMNMAKARQGILVYITPDRIAEYTITEPLSDAELELLVRETLENRRHPRYSWECQYCPFSMMCPWKQTNNNRYYKR